MELTVEQKRQVIKGMQAYILSQDTAGGGKMYSQNKFARDTRVNVGYLDAMVKGCESGDFVFNKVQIKDVYFERIAAFIGLELKQGYWRKFETEQYLDIESAFVEAKSGASVKTVIGGTGTGKTFTVEDMKVKYPVGTFVMRCANDYNLRDFVRYIAESIGVKDVENLSQTQARKAIERRIKSLHEAGQRPILVFDEAENLKLPAWGRIKAIYDNVRGECAFLIMGTPNWFRKMKRQRDCERDIAPQIFRRFMSGLKTVMLSPMGESDVKEICKEIGINDRYVVNKVCAESSNYGDLNDTLVGLQRAADAQGCRVCRELYENEYGKAC
ncbi:MAG: ATP-binding protein [Oscillibacter sp.]|nr:ATP-binding protein [Oscillibacter sp.]